MDNAQGTALSPRFTAALVYAAELHSRQYRKGSGVPYIAHLLAVAALVLEDGGDEDQAIAALLHDAAEDQGGKATLDNIRVRFGERVAFIVDGCTDTYLSPKPAWKERKVGYLDHLRLAPPDVVRVSLADKVHNARALLRDLRKIGEKTWDRFNGGRSGTLWYYQNLLSIFREISSSPLVEELSRILEQIERLSNDSAWKAEASSMHKGVG